MSGHELYGWIIKYPQKAIEKYRILCANCNWLERPESNSPFHSYSYNRRIRMKAIDKLGGKCVVCGITNMTILTIDHINNDGAIERIKLDECQIRNKIINSDLKEINKSYQCLCHTCQLVKERKRIRGGREYE